MFRSSMRRIEPSLIYKLNDWLAGFELDFYVTVHPHREWTMGHLRKSVHETFLYTNRYLMGSRWYKPEGYRVLPRGFIFIEERKGQFHAHCPIALDFFQLEHLTEAMDAGWAKQVVSGTANVLPIDPSDPLRLARYNTKELHMLERYKAWEMFGPKPDAPMGLKRYINGMRYDDYVNMMDPKSCPRSGK